LRRCDRVQAWINPEKEENAQVSVSESRLGEEIAQTDLEWSY
jgi:hypothetical protein